MAPRQQTMRLSRMFFNYKTDSTTSVSKVIKVKTDFIELAFKVKTMFKKVDFKIKMNLTISVLIKTDSHNIGFN